MALTKATHRMISGTSINVKDFGAVGDGVTDDTSAIQSALDYHLVNGGVLYFAPGVTYKCTSGLTLSLTSESDGTKWNIQGNDAYLDFSSVSSGAAFTVGDTTMTYITTNSSFVLQDLTIIGNEVALPIWESSAAGTLVGLFINYVTRVSLENVYVKQCYTGIKTAFVFPLIALNCSVRDNFIGVHLDDVSNIHRWINTTANQCRYSVLIHKSDTYSTAKITNVVFDGLHVETCQVGVHIDSGVAGRRLKNIVFRDGFYKDVTYDVFRIGIAFNFSTPETRGADTAGKLYRINIDGGNFPTTTDADSGILVFSNLTSNVKSFRGLIPIDSDDSNAVINEPAYGELTYTGLGDTSERTTVHWSLGSTFTPILADWSSSDTEKVYEEGVWTPTITFTTPGDLSVAYTSNVGTYTKIGRLVSINFNLNTSAFTHTTASGELRILGMPFPLRTLANYYAEGSLSCYGIDKTGFTQSNLEGRTASSILLVYGCGIAGLGISSVKVADVPTGGDVKLRGSLTYEIDD